MLQQTPVARVLTPWQIWVDRWPTPPALAAAPAGEAVRAWGRLGLSAPGPPTARGGHRDHRRVTTARCRATTTSLLALPGVGSYTAAAIASFAFGRRHVVLDTNVRRVLARIDGGEAQPPAARDARRGGTRPPVPAAHRPAGRPLGGRLDGARSLDLHGADRPAAMSARWLALCRWHRLGPSRSRPCRAAPRAVVRRHRPAVSRRAAGGPALDRRAGASRASWPLRGPSRSSGGAAWTPCSADGLIESVATAGRYALPS